MHRCPIGELRVKRMLRMKRMVRMKRLGRFSRSIVDRHVEDVAGCRRPCRSDRNDLTRTPVKGRGTHGLELTGQFCARRGLLVGVEGGLVAPSLVNNEPVGPIELLQQRYTHISGLLEGPFTVLPEQRNALICGTRRDVECHHAIDGAAVGLGLRGAFGVDREQYSQTQEVSNESWPRRPMIA